MEEQDLTGLRVVYFVTEKWYFDSHRRELALTLSQSGAEVSVGCKLGGDSVDDEAIRYFEFPFKRTLQNPLSELLNCLRLWRKVRDLKPDIVHLVALKPIITSGIAAWLLPNIRFVQAFAGLGYLFSSEQTKAKALQLILRMILRFTLAPRNVSVLLQNQDDRAKMLELGLVRSEKIALIPGSGIDCTKYEAEEPLAPREEVIVMFAGRIIRDKGILEYIEAAKLVKKSNAGCRFQVFGQLDPDNPAALGREVMDQAVQEGSIEWYENERTLAGFYANADIVCLPSYREGLPKVLLEAAASGKPMIATDVPGCREICRQDQTGLLVPARNFRALAAALQGLIRNERLRKELGQNARRLVQREFSLPLIAYQTGRYYRGLLES